MPLRSNVDVRAVIEDLRQGFTPDQIYSRHGRRRAVYLTAIEEEAANCGELNEFSPTTETVIKLRDRRRLRWERIAARVFGDAGKVAEAKRLYDSGLGAGAAARSYTGAVVGFPK